MRLFGRGDKYWRGFCISFMLVVVTLHMIVQSQRRRGGPGASHGIICPQCTLRKLKATTDQYIVPAMTSSLAAVGKKGNVFFLNEIASKFRSSCDCLQFSVWTTSGPSELWGDWGPGWTLSDIWWDARYGGVGGECGGMCWLEHVCHPPGSSGGCVSVRDCCRLPLLGNGTTGRVVWPHWLHYLFKLTFHVGGGWWLQ